MEDNRTYCVECEAFFVKETDGSSRPPSGLSIESGNGTWLDLLCRASPLLAYFLRFRHIANVNLDHDCSLFRPEG